MHSAVSLHKLTSWNDIKDQFWCFVLQVLYLQQAEVTREQVCAMHQSSIDGVEDMSALADLHEAAIMHNLYQRYQKDNIYVSAFRMCVVECVLYVRTLSSCLPPYFPVIL